MTPVTGAQGHVEGVVGCLSSCTTHASSLRTRQQQAKDMNPNSKPGFRKFYKDAGRRIQGLFKPPSPQPSSSANPPSHTPSTQSLPIATHVAPPLDPSPATSEDATNTTYTPSIYPPPTTDITFLSRVNIPSSANPPPPTTSAFQAAKEIGSVTWAGLETALRVLKESSDVFPPLKSAVSGLLVCLDVFQVNLAFNHLMA
jgi:hypothetical protein